MVSFAYTPRTGDKPGSHVHVTEFDRNLSIDHDHDLPLPMSIRGLLCRNCNTGIGLIGDKLEDVQNALDYLVAYRDSVDHSKEPGTRG